jgi:RNA polymerase sigma factor (sigma-70 family)
VTSKPVSPKTPEQLFVRFRDGGDLAALAAVFDAVAGELLLVAGHLVRDGALAEDLLQTTFVEAMRAAKRYDARRPLVPWLATILTHHARKLQRQQRRAAKALPAAARGERGPLAAVLDREALGAIERGLARLEAPYREVLTLRLVHDLSPAAIAHALGCPPETVRTRCKRGLELLRRHLPAGLGAGLALLLASGRGLAAVRADVVQAGRELARKSTTVTAATAALFGGMVMKQLVVRATLVVAFLVLGWWGVVELTAGATAPGDAHGGAARVAASLPSGGGAAVAIDREAANEPPPPSDEIVFVGRCVDPSGTALAGVTCLVHRDLNAGDVCDNELDGYLDRELNGELDGATVAARAESAADGTFRLACARGEGLLFDVRIGNRGHQHRTRRFGPYAGAREVELGDIALRRGVQVSVRVVDRSGTPVAGVRVVAHGHQPAGRHEMLMVDQGFPWRSDARGHIELPYAMGPGHYHASFWSDDFPADRINADLVVPHDRDHFHTDLVWPVEDVRHAILGVLVDVDGKPLAGVAIGAEGGGTRGNAETRADGTFRMPRIGPYDPLAVGPVRFGLPEARCGLELVGDTTCSWGDRAVCLAASTAATLVVRAVDATSKQVVPDIEVACAVHRDDDAPAVLFAQFSPLESAPDGTVRRRVMPRPHVVQVFPRDARYAPSAMLEWDPRLSDELVVPLTAMRDATVRVVTADGKPVAGSEVRTLQPIEAVAGEPAPAGWREVPVPAVPDRQLDAATRWARQGIDDAPLGSARTDADGYATVRVPLATDVLVAAFGPGHVAKAVVGRATTSTIELRVDAGASVRIDLVPKDVVARLAKVAQPRLRAAGSQDLVFGGMSVTLLPTTKPGNAAAAATAAMPITAPGIVVQHGLPAGQYDVYVAGCIEAGALDGVNLVRKFPSVTLHAGEPNELQLDVSGLALGRLQGQVLRNGEPWPYVAGNLGSMDWPAYRSIVPVHADAQGRFDVEAPAIGRYQFHTLDQHSVRCAEKVQLTAGATMNVVFAARICVAHVRIVAADGTPRPGLTVTSDEEIAADTLFVGVTDDDGCVEIRYAPSAPFHLTVTNPEGPARAGRRVTNQGDAVLGPFEIPPTGDRAEFRAVLPADW